MVIEKKFHTKMFEPKLLFPVINVEFQGCVNDHKSANQATTKYEKKTMKINRRCDLVL